MKTPEEIVIEIIGTKDIWQYSKLKDKYDGYVETIAQALRAERERALAETKAIAAWAEKAKEALQDFGQLECMLQDCATNECVDCKEQYGIRATKARACLSEWPREK